MKRVIGLLTGAAALLGTADPASAADWYLAPLGGGSACTLTAPCGDYRSAISKAQPGDTVYVRGGTILASTDANNRAWWDAFGGRSGTASAPITLKAYPGETPVFDGGCTGPSRRDAYPVTQEDQRCTGDSPYGAGEAFCFRGSSSYIVLDGLRIQHFANSFGNGAICFNGSDVNHLTFRNLVLLDNGTNAQDHHLYPSSGPSNDILVERSQFWRAYGGGIHIYHLTGPQRMRIQNNLFVDNLWGILAGGDSNTEIINNTFYNTYAQQSSPVNASIQTDTDNGRSTVLVRNNVSCNTFGRGLDRSWNTVTATEDHNVWGCGGGVVGMPMSSTSTDTDPLLVAPPGDLRLQPGSPAIDSGSSLLAPSVDFAGVARPQGAGFDRGAYERAAAAPVTTTHPVDSDTFVRSDIPAANFNNAAELELDGTPVRRILLAWDDVPTGTIAAAKLRVHVNFSTGQSFRVRSGSCAYDPALVTYNVNGLGGGVGSSPQPGAVLATFASDPLGWNEISIPASSLSAGYTCLQLDKLGADWSNIQSMSDPSRAPRLVITR